jgi:capsular polysaccharide export protein
MRADLGAACFSPEIMRIPHLEALLGHRPVFAPEHSRDLGAVIVWGQQDNLHARQAQMFAKKHRLPLWRLADGFLRSLDIASPAPMSLVADGSGLYYDANQPSDLEKLLNETGWETPELLAAAEKGLRLIRENLLSKYNHGRPAPEDAMSGGKHGRRRILVLDQARGEAVHLGLGGLDAFQVMLKAARYEHPGEEFYIKTHPEVLAGLKEGYFDLRRQTGLTVLDENFSPLSLLAQADEVYTVNSLMGFEALFLDKTVHCFGLPFYAGWGLTQDRLSTTRRTRERTLPELFAAAYILYPRYVNPVTGRPADIFEALRLLSDQTRQRRATQGSWVLSGFAPEQREAARPFFSGGQGGPAFARNPAQALRLVRRRKQGRLAVWADGLDTSAYRTGEPGTTWVTGGLMPMGAEAASRSLILDPDGLYHDGTRASGLEKLLQNFDFNAHQELVVRAEALLRDIIKRKARPEQEKKLHFEIPGDRRVILVPGQPVDDPALIHGSLEIITSAALLAEVRRLRPEGFIIYQPPPAGTRRRNQAPETASPTDWVSLADQVAVGQKAADLLDVADEVHTISSPLGFEALLRGLETHTYGAPFYAGWQLTTDRLQFSRRGRRLSTAELAAGALILYPCYYDRHSQQFCGPEEFLHLLSQPDPEPGSTIFAVMLNYIRKIFS